MHALPTGCSSSPSLSTGVSLRPGRGRRRRPVGWYSIAHVTSDMPRFRQGFVQVKLACRVQMCQNGPRVGRGTVVRAHDDVVLGARGQAIPLHHDGNQRSWHDGRQEEQAIMQCETRGSRYALLWWKATTGWSGTCPMKAALTADLSSALCCSTVHDERHLNPT